MIDLRNTCILVRTKKEYEEILKEAEKQGFHWYGNIMLNYLSKVFSPDVLKFSSDNLILGGVEFLWIVLSTKPQNSSEQKK